MADQVLWFVGRGSGIVSLLLSSAVVCLGLLTAARWGSASWPRFLSAELHRSIALLGVAFVGLHVVTVVVDPFASLGLAAAIVPLASSYRPVAVALGVVSVDLVLAVLITSLLRDVVGPNVWRAVHWLAYAAWPLAVAHTLTAGSDAFAAWMLGLTGGCVLAVAGSLLVRLRAGRSPRASLAGAVARQSARGARPVR